SRRRHTRFSRDWSSDVCSSDLEGSPLHLGPHAILIAFHEPQTQLGDIARYQRHAGKDGVMRLRRLYVDFVVSLPSAGIVVADEREPAPTARQRAAKRLLFPPAGKGDGQPEDAHLLFSLSHAALQFRSIPAMKRALSDHAQVFRPQRGEVVSRLCWLGRAHVAATIAQALEQPPIAVVARPHGAGVVAATVPACSPQLTPAPPPPTAR